MISTRKYHVCIGMILVLLASPSSAWNPVRGDFSWDGKVKGNPLDDAYKDIKKIAPKVSGPVKAPSVKMPSVTQSRDWLNRRFQDVERSMTNTPFDQKTWLRTRDELLRRAQNTPFDPSTWERTLVEGMRQAAQVEKQKREALATTLRDARIDRVYKERLDAVRTALDDRKSQLDDRLASLDRKKNDFAERMASRARSTTAGMDPGRAVAAYREVPMPTLPDTSGVLDRIRGLKLPDTHRSLVQTTASGLDAAARFDRQVIRPSIDAASDASARFDQQVIRPVVDYAKDTLEQEVVVYDITTRGDLTVNLETGSYWVRFQLPSGMSLDSTDFQNLMNGSLSLPDIDPIEMAMAGSIVKESGYQDQARRYGPNTYFVSQRFADWFGLETLVGEGAKAYFTGGESAQDTANKVKELIILEWNDLVTWLKSQAVQYAEDLAFAAVQAMLSGESLHFSDMGVRLEALTIPYRYSLEISDPSGLLRTLDRMGVASLPRSRQISTSPHLGFALTVPRAPQASELRAATRSLQRVVNNPSESMAPVLEERLRLPAFRQINQVLNGNFNMISVLRGANGGGSFNPYGFDSSFVRDQVVRLLGLDSIGLANRIDSTGALDLMGTQAEWEIANLITLLTMGNQGGSRVDDLRIDLGSRVLSCRATLRHRHSWGSISDIESGVRRWANRHGRNIDPATIIASLTR